MLLERDIELKSAERFLADVRDGTGSVLVLEGAPGIGKTALLGAVGKRAADHGTQVLQARASQLDRGFPFGLARQLLERRVRMATVTERKALLIGAAHDALPALGIANEGAANDEPRSPLDDDGLRSLHGLYWLSANLAGRGSLVLCIDDAHWADRSSLRWLLYCAPRLTGVSLGLAISTRPREPGAEQDLLDELTLDDCTHLVKLQPLSAKAVGVMIDASLSTPAAPEFQTACHHSTGGNPLLVRELLRELAAEGTTPDAEHAGQLERFGVEAVARNVRRRLHGLGPLAEQVAHVIAVLGNGATVAEVASLCDCDEDTVTAAAVELAATDVLVCEVPLAFVHPLVRAAVYEDMAAVHRAALHRRAAEQRDTAGDPEGVAVHLLHVEPRADRHTVEVLRAAAAEAVGRGAPDAAARFLKRALVEPPATREAHATVLTELGRAEALGRMDGFEEHLSAAIETLGDVDEAAEVALSLGRALATMGHGERAFEVVENATAHVARDSDVGLLLDAELLALAQGWPQLRPLVSDRVRDHLTRLERGLDVDAAALGPLSAWLLREYPPAENAVQAAEAALADERVTSPLVDTIGMPSIGYTLLGAGRVRRAGEVYDAAIADARRRGTRLKLGWASIFRAEVSYRLGEVVKAEGEARLGVSIGLGEGTGKAGAPIVQAIAAGMLINVLVARGELDEAERYAADLPVPLPSRLELFLPARAELRLAQGRVEDAIADLRAVGDLLGDEFNKPIQNWRAKLAMALALAGERDQARELAATELAQAQRWEVPLAIGVSLTAAGVVEGGSEGVTLLEQAVVTLAQTDGRLDHAISVVELGALLRRTGSKIAAREQLRKGMDLAARCGATAHADRAHSELVLSGARPRRDRRLLSGPESLTAGELRVASLAADGLTDRVIAQRLYVTQAAVQFHLRNVFRKLNIQARSDLAAVLAAPAGETGDTRVAETKA